MKAMKSLIAVTFLVVSTTLMAQTNINANQAFDQTSELVSSLNLSEEQTMDVLFINQKYANLEASKATNTKPSKKATKKLAAAKAKEIKSVLNANQKEKFETMVATNKVLAPQYTPSVAINNASQTVIFGADASYFPRMMR
jgi:hypothetical protein